MGRSAAAPDIAAIPIMPPPSLVSSWDPPDRPSMEMEMRAHVLQKGKMAMQYRIARMRATTTAAQAA